MDFEEFQFWVRGDVVFSMEWSWGFTKVQGLQSLAMLGLCV